jgi:hypothetical protein
MRLQSLGAVHEIRQIEVGGVVANDNVRINLLDEVTPPLQHLVLVLIREHLRADDMRTRVQREYVPDERLALACKLIISTCLTLSARDQTRLGW